MPPFRRPLIACTTGPGSWVRESWVISVLPVESWTAIRPIASKEIFFDGNSLRDRHSIPERMYRPFERRRCSVVIKTANPAVARSSTAWQDIRSHRSIDAPSRPPASDACTPLGISQTTVPVPSGEVSLASTVGRRRLPTPPLTVLQAPSQSVSSRPERHTITRRSERDAPHPLQNSSCS